MLLALLCFLPSIARAYDDETTDYVTIPAGSYIVDMGVASQTIASGLKPYGLVYSLVVNYHVPVYWAINPSKTKDGTDFTYNAKNYKAGPFIIRAEYVTTTVSNVIQSWRNQGVTVDGPISSSIANVPIYDTITSLARLALDTDNGAITADYLINAGIPSSAYSLKTPAQLTSCEDVFALPHADPTWSTHNNLINFVQSGGYVWSACHAVSVMENIDDPGDAGTDPNMNFLSTTGLVPYGSHSDGSTPFTYRSSADAHPIAQFLGTLDAATQNGSEQIYLPKLAGAWRATTTVYVYDPTQADVPGNSPGDAAVVAWGRAFGNSAYGRVMYEGGHDHAKSAGTAWTAAQRAFLNFYFLAGLEHRPEPTTTVPSIMTEQVTTNISVSVTGGSGPYTYNWTSSVGGTFGNSNAASTTFTPLNVVTNTPAVLTVTITDSCGRVSFQALSITVQFIPTSDMSVTKTDSQDPVAAGGSFNYTLSVVNAGTDPATNVVVTDTLAAGATFSSASGSGWSCGHSAGVVTCTRATLSTNVGNPSTITITVSATNVATTLTNTVSVTSTNFDNNLSNNTNSITTTVISGIDLALTKTGSTNGYTGVALPYTLTVTNKTQATATNVVITDMLPPGATYSSASGSGWSVYYDSGTHVVTLILTTLSTNASSTVTVTVVPATNAASTTITNTATVTSSSPDPDSSNNSASLATAITAAADLGVVKSGDFDSGPNPDAYTFSIDLVNNGSFVATSITVTDKLTYSVSPFPLYFSNAVASVGTYTSSGIQGSNGGKWEISSLAPGETATLTLYYGGGTTATFTNTAQIFAVDQYDPVSANNSDSAILDKDFKEIDLGVLKVDTTDPVQAGSNITYTITATNASSIKWDGSGKTLTVTDVLPAGTTYVSASGTDWSCSHSSGTVTCTYTKDIGAGQAKSFTLVVTAPSTPGTITNTATMSYTRPNSSDPNPDNDSYSQPTTVTANVDLSVSKSVNNSTPNLNSNVTFTVTVSNLRSNSATNVRITEALPTGLTYASESVSQGVYDESAGYWYVGSLAVGASATLTLTATATGVGWKTNTATLSALTQTDTNSANDSASATVNVQAADLALGKTVDNSIPNVGSNVTFTVAITNLGPTVASNIMVSDTLPSGLTYVSSTPSQGTYDSGTGVWSAGTLASNANASLTLVATVAQAGGHTNTATVSSASISDPTAGNDSASAGLVGQQVDIALGKSVDNDRPLGLGSNLVFTVSVTNLGPSTASNVVLSDVLPTGLGYVSDSPSQGSYNSGSGSWSVGTLTNTGYATLTLTATNSVTGRLTNTVSFTSVSQTESNSANNTASVIVYSGGEADLFLTKSVNNPTPTNGELITFTLDLINYGPDPASSIVVTDALPAGLTFLDAVSPGTSYSTNTGLWTISSLANGETKQLTIRTFVTGSGQIVNAAGITNSTAADPDPIGNTASATINVITVNSISGRVFKDTGTGGGTANNGTRESGEGGLAGATLRLTDTSGATTYSTATSDGGGYYVLYVPTTITNSTTLKVVELNVPGDVSTGAELGNTSGTYDRSSDTISFTFTPGTTYTNVNFGDVPPNNFSADSQQANLPGTFVLHPHSFIAGSVGSVTFSVTNAPAPSLTGWSEVVYRDANCNGQLDPGEAVVTGAISAAAGDKICILVKDFIPLAAPLNAQNRLTVTATFTYTNASPALSTNSVLTDLTTVGSPTTPGLTLLKSVNKETALPGETLSYTITYENKGVDLLRNIVIYDQTPAFTTFLSATNGTLPNHLTNVVTTAPSAGASGALRWTFSGTLAPTSSGTVTYSVTVAQ